MKFDVSTRSVVGREKWDAFVGSNEAWIYQYDLLEASNLIPNIEDVSFAVTNLGQICALVALTIDLNRHWVVQKLPFKPALNILHSNGIACKFRSQELQHFIMSNLHQIGAKTRASEITCSLPSTTYTDYNPLPGMGFTDDSGEVCVIDLREEIDTLWKDMDKRGRNGIRYAEKSGIQIRPLNNDVDIIYDLHNVTFARIKKEYPNVKLSYYSKEYFAGVMNALKGHSLSLVAEYESEPVALSVFAHSKKAACYWWNYSNEMGLKYRANSLLQWVAIQKLKDLGIGLYEIGEVSPFNKTRTHTYFKRSFGGKICKWYRGRLVLDRKAEFFRKVFLRIYG